MVRYLGSWVSQLDATQQQAFKQQLGGASSIVSGGVAADSLSTGSSSDFVFGKEDNDTLQGNQGNDYLDGGAGMIAYSVAMVPIFCLAEVGMIFFMVTPVMTSSTVVAEMIS